MRTSLPTEVDVVMHELEALATEHTKKAYLSKGVREPFFGVPTGAMKPLKKRIGVDQELADALWDTGNYDAMYLAGMIADVDAMTEADFERWIGGAYSPMLADFVVAVTLAESDLAIPVAHQWVRSQDDAHQSAGWACYEWLLGWRSDDCFDVGAVRELLQLAADTIHDAPRDVRRAMNNFIIAVGVSYLPLHKYALETAKAIGLVKMDPEGGEKILPDAAKQIRKAAEKGRVGFKRRAVRC